MEPSDLYLSDLGLFLKARWQEWRLQVSCSMERESGPSEGIQRSEERLSTMESENTDCPWL